MRTNPAWTGLRTTRSFVSTGVVLALLAVGHNQSLDLAPAHPVQPSHLGGRLLDPERPLWKNAWSEEFPGCVSVLLWPADEEPVALLTRTPGGQVDRVEAGARPALDLETVGVCR